MQERMFKLAITYAIQTSVRLLNFVYTLTYFELILNSLLIFVSCSCCYCYCYYYS
jgi:hypothetical protein